MEHLGEARGMGTRQGMIMSHEPWPQDQVTPSRHERNRTSSGPMWAIVLILVAVVLITGAALVIWLDYRQDVIPIRSLVTSTSPAMDQISVDTIAGNLKDQGFDLEPLVDTTDAQFFAYEAADTKINGVEAFILTFKDQATTKDWAVASDAFDGIAVIGDTWAISLESDKERGRSKLLAKKIAATYGGTTSWKGD